MEKKHCILFDWGDTLMRVFPEFHGPMYTWPHVEALPDAAAVLAELQADHLLALATNAGASDETNIRKALDRVGLNPLIDKIYCSRTIGHQKPSPEFYHHILQDLAMAPQQVVMVGDSFEGDVLGANQVGISAVWFNEKSEPAKKGKMYRTIQGLGELPEVLSNWGSPIDKPSDFC